MTQATELRELASLIHVDGSNSYVGVSSTAFTPTDAFIVKDDGARITVESADMEVAMLGRRGSSGAALDDGYLRLRRAGVTADGVVLNTNGLSWLNGGNVGIGTNSPDALLHISDTSPHIDFGPHGGNRGKIGYHNLDVIIGSTSGTGSIIFKNNISSTDSPQTSGDVKMTIADGNVDIANKLGVNIASDSTAIFRAGWASSGTTRPTTLYSAMIETNSDQDGLGLFTTDDRNVRIIFGSPTNNVGGQILYYTDTSTPHMKFFTRGSEVMALKEGKVGIGTDAPVQTLDVDGSIGTRQVRHSIAPTLNLDFANSKELDSRITFYRNSIATYYDSKGIIRYANTNEPRFDHDPATGKSKGLLMESSKTFMNMNTLTTLQPNNAFWGQTNATVSVKQAVAPDGTFSADGIHANTVNDGHGLFRAFVPAANTYYTITGYYKRGANRFVSHAWYYNEAAGASNYPTAYYDLDNGTFTHTSGINRGTTMTDVGNGWYRCSLTVLSDGTPGTTSYFYATSISTSGAGSYVGTGAIDTYYWGLQIEIGSFPSSFMPSDTGFASRSSIATYHDETGILRTAPIHGARHGYKYDGRKWVETGLILEAPSTNIITYSQDLTNWNATRTTLTSNVTATTAPDGSYTADKLTETAVTGEHAIIRHVAVPTTGRATLSIYAKAAERSVFGIQMYNGGGGVDGNPLVYFDLSAGVVNTTNGGVIDSTISFAGNGWWRITLTGNISVAGVTASCWMYTSNSTTYTSHLGEVGKGVYLWGGQLEATSDYASSYIHTLGTSLTRSADVDTSIGNGLTYTREEDDCRINDISDFYNTQEYKGTLYREISFNESLIRSAAQRASTSFYSEAPTSGNIILRAVTSPTAPYLDTIGTSASGVQWDLGPSPNIVNFNEVQKQSVSFEDNNITGAVNGVSISSDNDAEVPLVTTLRILDANDTTACVRKIVYYPEALTIAEQLALTENN